MSKVNRVLKKIALKEENIQIINKNLTVSFSE